MDSEFAKDTRAFIDSQSSKLGMDPEEYAVKHYEKTQEISVYDVAYMKEDLGDLADANDDYSEKANALLEKLAE